MLHKCLYITNVRNACRYLNVQRKRETFFFYIYTYVATHGVHIHVSVIGRIIISRSQCRSMYSRFDPILFPKPGVYRNQVEQIRGPMKAKVQLVRTPVGLAGERISLTQVYPDLVGTRIKPTAPDSLFSRQRTIGCCMVRLLERPIKSTEAILRSAISSQSLCSGYPAELQIAFETSSCVRSLAIRKSQPRMGALRASCSFSLQCTVQWACRHTILPLSNLRPSI